MALELAALLRPKGVILIGSCRSPDCLTPLARYLRVALSFLPVSSFQPRAWSLRLAGPMFGRLTGEKRDLFWSMARSTPASFLRWGIGAVLSWRPTVVATTVHHIHGSRDRLIPLRLVQPDRVVLGGGHLLTLTHSGEVTAFLRERVPGLDA